MTVQNLSIEELDSEDLDIVSFTKFNEEHRANACCELPAHIFVKAVQLARCIDWEKESQYWNNWEAHPAIKLICDWWNTNAPDPSVRCAGSFSYVVRVDNGSKYIDLGHGMYMNSITPDGEYPTASFSNCNARLNDVLLFMFQKGKAGYTHEYTVPTRNEIYYATYLVDGDIYSDTVGRSIDNADDSRFTLNGLYFFPKTFPRAWALIAEESESPHLDHVDDAEPDYENLALRL